MKWFVMIPAVAIVLVGALAATARADECDKLTYLTFSAPVRLPAVTLPAGTYRFTHPDCGTSSGLLRVASQDGTAVYGTFLTIPEERQTPGREAQVVFGESPAGAPEAIAAWFYPGDKTGDELIYPHGATIRVADSTSRNRVHSEAAGRATEPGDGR